PQMDDPAQLREEGNGFFKAGDFSSAISCYSKAIKVCQTPSDLATLYRNRAACYLKTEKYAEAATDSTKAIDVNQSDIKALFRRCQALEKLGKLDHAYKDVQRCATIQPNNRMFLETLQQLRARIQEKKLHEQFSTDRRVEQMFEILFDSSIEKDKKETAAHNLIVLAREEAGAERIFRSNGVALLQRLMESKDVEMLLAAMRTLSELCKEHRARATAIMYQVGLDKLCGLMAQNHEEISLASCNILQTIYTSLTGKDKSEHIKREEAIVKDVSKDLRRMLLKLLDMLIDKKVSIHGRDNCLNLLIKNVPCKTLHDRDNSKTIFLTSYAGLPQILTVAGAIPELPDSLPVTDETRLSASVLLHKLYDDLRNDTEREVYDKLCDNFVTGSFSGEDMTKNLHAIQTISGLLAGPYDVGNRVLGQKGVLETIISLAGSESELEQLVATEALVLASAKTSRATFITTNGITLLKDIYKRARNDKIKIRALVGLCKLGSAGGTDYSMRQFAEGSTEKLAKQCRKWLCCPTIDNRTKRWAVEGLAYLTLDADVKDDFVEDEAALKAMFDLARAGDKTIIYSVSSALVNCTNSYDTKERVPELVQLAKYTKQHIPEDHPKSKKNIVIYRLQGHLQHSVYHQTRCPTRAHKIINLSQNSPLWYVCAHRVFLALAEDPNDRGIIISHGGGKGLIPLALEGTKEGKIKAAHALAKLTINANPRIVFHGETIYEVVRPLVSLLNSELDGLPNFEGLMALTNLAGDNEKLRQKIIKEKAMPEIENYMFEEHEQIRLAATQCMCNMVISKEVQEMFLKEGNDRLKMAVLLCGEDEEPLQIAASGMLAMLTSAHKSLCSRVPTVTTQWLEILQRLLLHKNGDVQHRGMVITLNLMLAERDIAQKLMECEVLEILIVLSKDERPERMKITEAARACLTAAMDYGLIKPFS
uniref:Protein unc-45 homolog B n=1 Tax=Petromyzon marinus TaxID=7757 RepID=S4RYF5_PETMA